MFYPTPTSDVSSGAKVEHVPSRKAKYVEEKQGRNYIDDTQRNGSC